MKLLLLILLLLTACSAQAERKEHSRFALSESERIIQYVEETEAITYCWLALQKGDEEPVIFWSREPGDVITWGGRPGVIAGADKSGDDVFVVLSPEAWRMSFIQFNLKTKRERLTTVPKFVFEEKFDLVMGGKFKVEAPNRILGYYRYNLSGGKNKLLEWREDGKPYLDGEPFYHLRILPSPARHSGSGTPSLPAASLSPITAAPVKMPLRPSPSRNQQSSETDASGWLLATALLILLGGGLLFWKMKSRT